MMALLDEPGIGKTRLAQEASLRALERGSIVLVGRCYEERASLPCFPFVEALSAGLKSAPDELRRHATRRWPALNALFSNTSSKSVVDRLDSSEDARLRLFSAVAAFIRELSVGAPVALLLDDMHWADSASVGLLVHLARDLAADRVLLLATFRDTDVRRHDPLAAAIRDLTRERLLERVVIRGLGLEHTATLIGARVGLESIPDEFARVVHARTEGNPFFVEEIVTALAERQLHTDAAGSSQRLVGNPDVPLPDSVRAVIDQRLERVAPRVRELLRVASVLGQEFDVQLLLAVAPESEDAVLAPHWTRASFRSGSRVAERGTDSFTPWCIRRCTTTNQRIDVEGTCARATRSKGCAALDPTSRPNWRSTFSPAVTTSVPFATR
jgi:predicted ATPase